MNPFGGDIKVDLSNYAKKADLKDAAGIDKGYTPNWSD